jgi:hypothetical protein
MPPVRRKDRPRGDAKCAALRAARAFSDLQSELWAYELGVSRATLARYETTAGLVPDAVLIRAAELTGLPQAFMLGDVSALGPDPNEPTTKDLLDRLDRIEAGLAERVRS